MMCPSVRFSEVSDVLRMPVKYRAIHGPASTDPVR
jgi:hypothetical protein